MSKQKSFRPPFTERFATPIMKLEGQRPVVMCPFCVPSHELSVTGPSACGTLLQLRSVQRIYEGRLNKDLVCVKCGQGGGKLVHFNDAFIHTHNCKPGVLTFSDPPKFSRLASLIHKGPAWIKRISARLGKTMAVEEVLPDGKKTGKILGYVFYQSGKA